MVSLLLMRILVIGQSAAVAAWQIISPANKHTMRSRSYHHRSYCSHRDYCRSLQSSFSSSSRLLQLYDEESSQWKKKSLLSSTPKHVRHRRRPLHSSTSIFNDDVREHQRISTNTRRIQLLIGAVGVGLLSLLCFPSKAFAAAATTIVPSSSIDTVTTAAASVASNVAYNNNYAAIPTVVSTATVATKNIITREMEIKLSCRLLFAALMGGIVGWERSDSNCQSAGLRTMALVSLGAAAYTLCSMYGFVNTGLRFDASRMAANVASGVGFIGAGVITTHSIKSKSSTSANTQISHSMVHGLTTAAAIWLSAAVGVASGAGLYLIACTASLTTVSILRFGRNMKQSTIAQRIGVNNNKMVDTDNKQQRSSIFIPKYNNNTKHQLEKKKKRDQQQQQELLQQQQQKQSQQQRRRQTATILPNMGNEYNTRRNHDDEDRTMTIKNQHDNNPNMHETSNNNAKHKKKKKRNKTKAEATTTTKVKKEPSLPTTTTTTSSKESEREEEEYLLQQHQQQQQQQQKLIDAAKDKYVLEFQKSIENEISSVVPKTSNLTMSKLLVNHGAINNNNDDDGGTDSTTTTTRASSSSNPNQKSDGSSSDTTTSGLTP